MWIKNINGTSQTTCNCGSWLKHWERFSGKRASYCSEIQCMGRNLVGAHVQKAYSEDKKWYIVPLCQTHNMAKGALNVGNTEFVFANKSETCG